MFPIPIARSSWLKSISYFNFCPKIKAIEIVTEYETNAIAKESTKSSFHRPKLGITGWGSPTGMWPTGAIAQDSSIFSSLESKVPPTTAINSIGIGILDVFATRGFKYSLLNTRMEIDIRDKSMATWFAECMPWKISTYVWKKKTFKIWVRN